MRGGSKATIAGFPAEFRIKFEQRFDRNKFEAETSNLNLPAGTSLNVCFGTDLLGNLVIGPLKTGELELDSRKGATVPAFKEGDEIGLVQGACGVTPLMKASFGSPAAQNAPAQSTSLLDGKTEKLIQGFEAEFHVKLEHRADRDKFTAEVEGLNLGTGTRLDVCFGGNPLGDIFLNALNSGELEIDSRTGAGVPALVAGDVVELRQGGCGGALLMAVTMGASQPAGAQQGIRTRLSGKTKKVIEAFEAEFSARFETLGDRTKANAEVSNLNLPVGTILTVCLAATPVGDMVLNSIHFAELELDSRNGDVIPAAKVDDIVELHRQGCGSELLMSVKLALVP